MERISSQITSILLSSFSSVCKSKRIYKGKKHENTYKAPTPQYHDFGYYRFTSYLPK
jgi:hypothetical protein